MTGDTWIGSPDNIEPIVLIPEYMLSAPISLKMNVQTALDQGENLGNKENLQPDLRNLLDQIEELERYWERERGWKVEWGTTSGDATYRMREGRHKKVCRHCGTPFEWDLNNCPRCGKEWGKRIDQKKRKGFFT